MKKGIFTLVTVVLAGFVFLAVGALTAADVPSEVKIQNEGYKSDKKGAVNLSHQKHVEEFKLACTECHHEYKDGQNVWKEGNPVKKCAECHNPLKKEGKIHKLQNAYHKNCKDCHKKVDKSGEKAPHKKCNDCHEKK